MSVLLNQEGGLVSFLLILVGINVGQLCIDINQVLNCLLQVEGIGGDVQLLQDLVCVFNFCDKLAQKCGDNFILLELFVLVVFEFCGMLVDILKVVGVIIVNII